MQTTDWGRGGRLPSLPPHVRVFARREDHDSYLKAFDRLLRDLKAEA